MARYASPLMTTEFLMKFRIRFSIERTSVPGCVKKSKSTACWMTLLCLLLLCSCSVENSSEPNPDGDGNLGDLESNTTDTEALPNDPSPAQPRKRSELCVKCHEDHYEFWLEGGHRLISCTRCHGFVKEHTLDEIDPRPKMELHSDAELCLSCHGESENNSMIKAPKIEGFKKHVTYISEKHSVRIDLEKMENQCIFCHDPHTLE